MLQTSTSARILCAEDTRSSGKNTPQPRRVHIWHVASVVVLGTVGVLLIYAFWPRLTGKATENIRTPTDGVAETTVRIEAVVIERDDFPLRVEATGHLAPWRRTEISAEASSIITERPIEEGQRVAAGALLLRLDDRDQQIELQEAEAELLKASADYVAQIITEREVIPNDTTELAQAREIYQDAVDAFARGAISQTELNEVKRRLKLAEVSSGVQREAVQAVNAGLTQAEQRTERARLALSRTRVTAPFGGRIADLQVEIGQRISIGQKVLILIDDSRMKVEVDVLEANLVKMQVGATAQVRVPALDGERFAGTIYAINPVIENGTGRITVAIPNPQGRLIAGLFAYVELETQRLVNRFVVPAQAILMRQGRDLVFRVKKGHAQWTYVTLGERSGNYIEITEGLSPGDTVAVDGHFAIAHDAPVNVAVVRVFSAQ